MPSDRPRIRRLLPFGLAIAVLATAITGWYGTRTVMVARRLEAARGALLGLSPEALLGKDPGAQAALRRAHARAADARRITSGPSWTALTHAPGAGPVAGAIRDLSRAAEELSGAVIPALLRARTSVSAATPKAIAGAEPGLRDAERRLAALRTLLEPYAGGTGVGAVDRATGTAIAQVGRLHHAVSLAADAARVLPPMVGRDGPRRYFLALQTSAEARGTGGLVGAYGILAADRGKASVERLEPNHALRTAARPAVDLGPEFRRRYGEVGAASELAESNLSPHFPYAARIWTSLWQGQTGQRLDGAVATDPSGLAELLKVTGPVRVPGGSISAANAVDLTERVAYARYHDPVVRKRFLIQVATAVADALIKTRRPPMELARALARMASTGRLKLWSARPAEQALLARSPLGGVLPDLLGPYAQLVINNAGGNKLDHYLQRSVDYVLGPCSGDRRDTVVRVRLTNAAPAAGLPAYVTQRSDTPRRPHVLGSNRIWVSLYAARGARLTGALRDGGLARIGTDVERSHPVFDASPELLPGQSTLLEFHLSEPVDKAAPVVPEQPLTRPQTTRITTTARCGAGWR